MPETPLPRWEVTEIHRPILCLDGGFIKPYRSSKRNDGFIPTTMRTLVFYSLEWDATCKRAVVEYFGHDNCIVRRVDEWDAVLICDNAPPRETQTPNTK